MIFEYKMDITCSGGGWTRELKWSLWLTHINLYGFQRNPPKLPRPEIPPPHPQTKKNPMPKFYNRNALMLKTAKQVCRTTQPAYTRGTTPIFRLFSPKKTILKSMHPSKILDFTTQKNPGTETDLNPPEVILSSPSL